MTLPTLIALSPLAVLDATPDAVVVVGSNGSIIYSNSLALALFGYTEAELLHQPIEVLVPEQFREKHLASRALSRTCRTRASRYGIGDTVPFSRTP